MTSRIPSADYIDVMPGTCRNSLLLAGWTAFFALAYVISQSEGTETKVYDPFEILGLSSVSVLLELLDDLEIVGLSRSIAYPAVK